MGGGFGVERKNVKGGRYDGGAAPRSSGVGPGWCQGAGRRKTRRDDTRGPACEPAAASGSQSARAASRSPAPLILIADDGKHDTRLSSLNTLLTALSKTNFIKQY